MVGYVALVHKDEGTSYGVSFPDFPGCISAGDTMGRRLSPMPPRCLTLIRGLGG
jgi:hypothetical protein